jgi:exodeoxyribonuclease-3
MRLVVWNCNMALHRKIDAVLALQPDVAVISECAQPLQLAAKSTSDWFETEPVWIGRNPHKGLGVFAFNGVCVALSATYDPKLRYIAPIKITGSARFNMLAVWAQNASAGVTRKHQSGPLRRALNRYRPLLTPGPAVIAGDWNSNAIWDKPGWRINHMTKVRILNDLDIVSAYHAVTGEEHGKETMPTLYWRDRREDGPTYHIDFGFIPRLWVPRISRFEIGTFADWCGNGLSDHVPIILDIDL